jgi:hypothetical protein
MPIAATIMAPKRIVMPLEIRKIPLIRALCSP